MAVPYFRSVSAENKCFCFSHTRNSPCRLSSRWANLWFKEVELFVTVESLAMWERAGTWETPAACCTSNAGTP